MKQDALYQEKVEQLRILSVDKFTPEEDKEQMISILKILDKIANCELCHE
jgi:hypothetical protein